MTAPRHGMYAPRASLRPITHTPLTMDSVPQYLELPPAPSPPVGIMNRGYGMSPKSRGKWDRGYVMSPKSRDQWDRGYGMSPKSRGK